MADTVWRFRDGYWKYQCVELFAAFLLILVAWPATFWQAALLGVPIGLVRWSSHKRGMRDANSCHAQDSRK